MKIAFMFLSVVVLIAGLALLAINQGAAIAVVVASVTLAVLGLAAQQDESHRESVELMERTPPRD